VGETVTVKVGVHDGVIVFVGSVVLVGTGVLVFCGVSDGMGTTVGEIRFSAQDDMKKETVIKAINAK
jgi:hypothetical protein